MTKWFSVLIFAVIFATTKAHHIKLVLLALLGLAGLYYMQNNTQSGGGTGGNRPPKLFSPLTAINLATRFLQKRSINSDDHPIDWDLILSNDRLQCARSYVCQLAAETSLKLDEKRMLNAIESSQSSGISKLTEAIQRGRRTRSEKKCRAYYSKCPYSRREMIAILKYF